MPTHKDAIKEALESLDHKNDALWTEDGSPLVSEIQRLANDKTITRGQINDAFPGFARKSKDSVSEDEQPDAEQDEGNGGAPSEVATALTNPPGAEVQDEEDLDLSPEQENERLRTIAHQRVLDAEIVLTTAKNEVAEAQRRVVTAEQRHARALQVFSAKYPPISPEEAIKVHLRRQQEIQRERITGMRFAKDPALNPIDVTLRDRKRDNGRKGNAPTPFLPRKSAVSY